MYIHLKVFQFSKFTLGKIKVVKLLTLALQIGLIMILGSCASFESVKSTGKLAQNLNNFKEVYSTNPCDLNSAFQSQVEESLKSCDQYQKLDTISIKAFELINNYGKALETLIEDSEFDSEDQIELVLEGGKEAGWFNLSDDQISGSKSVVDATFKIVTNGVKRNALRKEFIQNNVAVQNLVNSLKSDLVARKQLYLNTSNVIKDYLNEDPELDADTRLVRSLSDTVVIGYANQNRLDRLTKTMIKKQIESDTIMISQTIKALTAFGEAHDILAKNFKKVGTKSDPEVAKEIFDNLKEIFDGIKKLEEESKSSEEEQLN